MRGFLRQQDKEDARGVLGKWMWMWVCLGDAGTRTTNVSDRRRWLRLEVCFGSVSGAEIAIAGSEDWDSDPIVAAGVVCTLEGK